MAYMTVLPPMSPASDWASTDRANLFLSSVVHDMRNALRVLCLSTTPDFPLSPKRMRQTLDLVRRQLEGLDRMAGDLLAATRPAPDTLELHMAEHDAGVLASGVVERYRPAFAHQLQLAIPAQPVPVRCDAECMQRVLGNLVSNALRYSPTASPVHVKVMRQDSEVVVSVKDHGIGIEPGELVRIFEPYQRGQLARQLSEGSGLGLSVARRIVEAHRGQIDVESAPDQGSTFSIRLPRSADRAGPLARPLGPPPATDTVACDGAGGSSVRATISGQA